MLTPMKTTIIATRLSAPLLATLRRDAARRGITVASNLRQMCVVMLSGTGDPAGKLAAVAEVLGLPKGASAESIIEAIGEIDDDDTVTDDPLAAAADPAPKPAATGPTKSVDYAALSIDDYAAREQAAALKAITAALGLDDATDASTIKSALAALLEATAEPLVDDPLAAVAEPPPVELTRLTREAKRMGHDPDSA